MLRSLEPFERDKEGKAAVNHDGSLRRIPPGYEQPKAREAMDEGELHYLEVAKERDEDLLIERDYRRKHRELLLERAQASSAKE